MSEQRRQVDIKTAIRTRLPLWPGQTKVSRFTRSRRTRWRRVAAVGQFKRNCLHQLALLQAFTPLNFVCTAATAEVDHASSPLETRWGETGREQDTTPISGTLAIATVEPKLKIALKAPANLPQWIQILPDWRPRYNLNHLGT